MLSLGLFGALVYVSLLMAACAVCGATRSKVTKS